MNRKERLRILERLAEAIGEHGYDVDLAALCEAAGLGPGEVAGEFMRKELAVLALYAWLAATFRETVELPEGPLSQRFRAAMQGKLAVLRPYRRGLTALLRPAIDPDGRLAVGGRESERVRLEVASIFVAVVEGSTDAPADPADRDRLAHVLYALHLLIVFTWLFDEGAAVETLDLADTVLPFTSMLPWVHGILDSAGRLAQRLLPLSIPKDARGRSRALIDRLLVHHRVRSEVAPEAARAAVHRIWGDRIAHTMTTEQPIHFVLPGFPAKSPNPHKVLGALPDRAERLALEALERLCVELGELHPVRLTIASDGHVFGPVVGVDDTTCDVYREAIRGMLTEIGARHLAWFDLEDAFGTDDGEALRQRLLGRYGESLDVLRQRGPTPLVDGIHRFLAEDEAGIHPEISKTQARARTRERAWETVRRSQAWGALVAAAFPDAVRLSIHPQPLASDKIGIHLLPVDDVWLTPWHGAALLDRSGYRLVKRADFPSARVVDLDGRPDHLEL